MYFKCTLIILIRFYNIVNHIHLIKKKRNTLEKPLRGFPRLYGTPSPACGISAVPPNFNYQYSVIKYEIRFLN